MKPRDTNVLRGIPRSVEVAAAAAGLLAVSPLLALAAAAIRMKDGRVLFRQERVGRLGRPFILYKLRTMRDGASGPGMTARGDPRVTPLGRLLRRTKIDELPELWNVLRGDMSLVGPRPEVPEYVDLSNPFWKTALESRPGITDPVTARLRNEEDLLAAVDGDRQDFYLRHLQPYKLRRYADYQTRRTWRSDVSVLVSTLFSVFFPSRAPVPTISDIVAETLQNRDSRWESDPT